MHCRTCYEDISKEDSHSLDELGWFSPQKTLAEIILEIAGIDTKSDSTLELQLLCDGCVDKIRICYEFVINAQKVNAKLQQQYNQSVESSYLEELPIDFPIPSCNIKTDTDEYETEKTEDCVDPTVDVKVEDFFPDPIVQLEEESCDANITDNSERVSNNDQEAEQYDDDDADDDNEEKNSTPIKRKRGRPRKTPKPGISGNICDVCGKSFNWHKDLIRHTKSHTMEPELKCEYCERLFLRRDKLKDHLKTHFKHLSHGSQYRATKRTEWNFAKRLYGKPVLKLVQCKLCGSVFTRISKLQQHMATHKDPSTFSLKPDKCNTKDFSDLLEWQTEYEIKANICLDLTKSNLTPYYSIVNEFGYELSLSDSDETDGDQDLVHNLRSSKYKCMLCSAAFNHQYKIFSHTLESHLNEKLPLKCNVCKVQFVCSEMLRQHERRQCKNKARKFQCSHCPGKFMWAENFENHQCSEKKFSKTLSVPSTRCKSNEKRVETLVSMRTTKKLQCGQCDKTFIWPKDLTRHMRMHLPDREKFQCTICQRRFNRKDNMQVHMKVHGEDATADSKKKECSVPKQSKIQAVDANLTIPNGCKVIECIICQSKQMRLSDLKVHLIKHQFDDSYVARWVSVEKIAESLYPELGSSLTKEELVNRITVDLAAQHYERFYSVTNEIGYEMNLSSSETETDTDSDGDYENKASKLRKTSESYVCELCSTTFDRKYKLFKHQSQSHQWDEAQYTCIHCNAKFVNGRLLHWHYNRQCKNTLKRFLCRKCPMRFMWKENLDAHVRTTHLEKLPEKKTVRDASSLRCAKCNRSFLMQKDLTRHLLMQSCCNENTEVLKCLYCPRKFYRKENLHAHMIRHGISSSTFATAECILRSSNKANGLKQIYCRVCNIAFRRINDLRAHLLTETKSTMSQHCTFESPLNYAITNSLGFEMQIDDSETDGDDEQESRNTVSRPPYQCTICNLFAKRRYEIAQHQLSMHKYEQLPFKCDRCIFRTVSQDILAQHMRSQCYNVDKKFQCDICQFKFMWPENLETHIRLYHYETKPNAQQLTDSSAHAQMVDTSSKGDQIIFQCDQCPCKYNRKDRLNAHIKKIHTGNSNGNSIIAINKKKTSSQQSGEDETKKAALEKKFLCAFCGRGLTSSSNLIIHMRRHTGEKPFKCDFCHMAFPRSSDLSAHRRKHTGEKPHACTICEKAFSRSYKLMLHMRTHTGERPHKCTYCEKSFTQSNDLTLHIRRHTGERPYVCGVCGERFIQGTALKNHRMMRGHYEETEDSLPV